MTQARLIARMYNNQKTRRKVKKPTYTYQEFKHWLQSQTEFHVMFDNWIRLDQHTDYVPSVDRIDNKLGYTISNIKLVTWKENNNRQYRDIKSGKEQTEQMRPVLQYTKRGEFVAEYHSMAAAMRINNISCIYKALNDSSKTAGGYKWTYK